MQPDSHPNLNINMPLKPCLVVNFLCKEENLSSFRLWVNTKVLRCEEHITTINVMPQRLRHLEATTNAAESDTNLPCC